MKKIEKKGMKSITGGKTVCKWLEKQRITICRVYTWFGSMVDAAVYDEKGNEIAAYLYLKK